MFRRMQVASLARTGFHLSGRLTRRSLGSGSVDSLGGVMASSPMAGSVRAKRRFATDSASGTGMMLTGRMSAEKSVLMVCDMQDKFAPVIHQWESAVHNTKLAVRAASLLGMSVVATEQYPRGLGHTVPDIKDVLPAEALVEEKTRFSMVTEQVEAMLREMPDKESVLLCGVETHVCVQQTALDLLSRGWAVHVLADATSSQRPYDRATALRRIETEGGYVTTVESAIFELLGDAKHPHFKAASQLVRERRPNETLMWEG